MGVSLNLPYILKLATTSTTSRNDGKNRKLGGNSERSYRDEHGWEKESEQTLAITRRCVHGLTHSLSLIANFQGPAAAELI